MANAYGIQFAGAERLRITQLDDCGLTEGSYVVYGPETIAEIKFSEEIDAPEDRERKGSNGRLQGSISQIPTSKYRNITITANARVPELDHILRGARLILNASGNSTGAGMSSQTNEKVSLEIVAPEDVDVCGSGAQDLWFLFPLTTRWTEDGDTTLNGADPGQVVYVGRGYANTSYDNPFTIWTETDPSGTATQVFVDTENFVYNKFAAASRPALQGTLTTAP